MKQNKKAFTLVELLIVIAIVGILAAIAMPRFLQGESARVSEALSLLAGIKLGEEDYASSNGDYCGSNENAGGECWQIGGDWATIGMNDPNDPATDPSRYFDYAVLTTNTGGLDKSTFCAVATRRDANPGGNAYIGDTICIDNNGVYAGTHVKGPAPGAGANGCLGNC